LASPSLVRKLKRKREWTRATLNRLGGNQPIVRVAIGEEDYKKRVSK